MKPKDTGRDQSKKDRPREFSTNQSTRRLTKMPEGEEAKKRTSLKTDSTTFSNFLPNMSPMNASNQPELSSISTSSKAVGNPQNSGNVSVMCRFRPLNDKEKIQSKDICVDFLDSQQLNLRSCAENNSYKFSFDRVFDVNSTQQQVYLDSAKPIVDSVLEGFNGTIFAYGQTSSGKTHTMQGIIDDPEAEGIIPRMIRNVFSHIMNSSEDIEFTVKVSMIEIYMEKIRDLIDTNRTNLNIREDRAKGLYIEDLSEHYVGGEAEVLELMKVGSENRAIAATNMNEHSSRSHSIFIMTIHQNNVKDLVAKTGKLYLVDLAGSEKISKTGATGSVLDEAKMINRSLTTLGMVINNLTDGKSQHIPYRESKLTRVLSESLGGNAKTCLVITCSPSSYNESETLSTLRFGLRAKKIKNKPKINKEVTVAELKIEIEKLEKFLITCNRRIIQLESFIVKNSLEIPKEGDMSFMTNGIGTGLSENSDKKKEISLLESEGDKFTQFINDDMITGISEIDQLENMYSFDKNLDDHKDKILDDISMKYAGVMAQLNLLEDDKKDLNYKLEYAMGKIKEYSDTLENKERLIDELGDIKKQFENKENELYEKIKDLQDKLEEKNIITKTNLNTCSNNSKTNSEIGYTSDNNISNNMDLCNSDNNLPSPIDEGMSETMKNEITDINSNIFTNFIEKESQVQDELYTKISEVIRNTNSGLNDKKEVNEKLNEIIGMIKNRLNFNFNDENENCGETKNCEDDKHKIYDEKNNKKQSEENESENKYKNNSNSKERNTSRVTAAVLIEKISNFEIVKKDSNAFKSRPTTPTPSDTTNTNSNSSHNNPINEETFKKEKRKYEHEKKLILKALEEKSDRISQFENENKELKDRIKLIESKMNPDDKNYVKKIISLEKNLDQVNLMYHQVVTQKSVLKIENQVYEKKIKKRNEKISSLEKESQDLKEQMKYINDKLNQYQKSNLNNMKSPAPNNVVKVIKGGTTKNTASSNTELTNFPENNSNIVTSPMKD